MRSCPIWILSSVFARLCRFRSLGLGCLIALVAPATALEAAPAPFGAGQVRLTYGLVRYELAGPRDCDPHACPLVVLVGGYIVPMVVWDATVPTLVRQGHSVLRFDFYGRGRSARPHVDYKPGLFADQMWELITTLGLVQAHHRFDVVASSMGGPVAALFATRHPDAIDKIVLVSPAGLSKKFPAMTTLLKVPGLGKWYFERQFRPIMLDHLQQNFRANVCAYPTVLAEVRRQLEVPGTSDAMYSTARLALLQDMTEEFRALGDLRRPTQVIWGSDDHLLPLAASREALDGAIPHRELWKVPAAAHLPQLERPHAFNDLVTEFLRQ